MPPFERLKTNYPGVFFIDGTAHDGRPEKIFYIRYRRDGKMVEEKAGRQYLNDMTAARAARLRAQRVEGKQQSNQERRELLEAKKRAKANKWTIERLWGEYKAQRPNLKGITSDENRFKNYILPEFGKKEPEELVPLDVDRLRIRLLKTKKEGTVRNVLELLRRIMNFGAKKQLTPPPGFIIELPRANSEKTEDLTPDQLSRLFAAIKKDSSKQAANLMKLALFTGMRRGELFKLQWDDIDFERGFITLRDPKGGQDQKIPLNDAARTVLKSHRRKRSSYVFPGRKGQQRTDIKHQVNRIKKRAGLPKDFRALHGLRHVYASMLASSGKVDMYTLQKLLTHKSPNMTQRYAHLRDEALRDAADLAGDILEHAASGLQRNK